MINCTISKKIVIIGADYKEKGGIASVIKSHYDMMETFNFIPSYVASSAIRKFYKFIAAVITLILYCVFRNIEIVHIHTASNNDFYRNSFFIHIAKLFNKKVLLHIHGGKFEDFYIKNKRRIGSVCRKADALITVSTYFADFLKRESLNNKIYLLPNAVAVPKKDITPKINNDKVNITYLGRIDDNKGVFEVLKCISENRTYFKDKIVYNVAGNGEIDRLKKYITTQNLAEMVVYHGWVDNIKKSQLLSSSDIYIQLSTFESFGISILEGMTYGLPVIASAVGGIVDIVEDKKNGLFVDKHNTNDIFNALKYLIENEAARASMGKMAKEKAKKYYPIEIERQLSEIYKSFK